MKLRGLRRHAPLTLAALSLLIGVAGLPGRMERARANGDLTDRASRWETRMEPVMAALPSDVSRVGYLDQRVIHAPGQISDLGEFSLTQYAIAPILLHDGTQADWIIGNFGNDVPIQEIRSELERLVGPHDLYEMGNGLFLIRRTGP